MPTRDGEKCSSTESAFWYCRMDSSKRPVFISSSA